MPSVACPTCGEKGRIPSHFIGIRIKCKMCGNSFLVTPPAPTRGVMDEVLDTTSPPPAARRPDGIAVEGLEPAAWSPATASPAVATAEHHEHDHDPEHDEAASAFTASPPADAASRKEYKLLTPKDPWFDGKFDLVKLEEALNHFARLGWVVRSMATPHVATFSGGTREELVVLLER